ncbi:hypothetical protein KX473_23575, partial [Escherichia coli]|nr:hypothetical protein [Escherichia coli]
MNTPKKRAFIYPNINIKTSTFSIYLAVKMMGIHDANNQNATNKNCNAFFIIPPTINVQLHLNTPQFGRMNRPDFPGECFICELRLPDHCFRWKHNKLFLLLPEEYGPAFP